METLAQTVDPQKHSVAGDDSPMPKTKTAPDPRVAENLRRLMRQKEYSQLKLQQISKVGQSTISRLLAGEDSPTTRTLAKLAGAFGVSVDEFFRSSADDPRKDAAFDVTNTEGHVYAGALPTTKEVPVIGIAKMSEDGVYTDLAATSGLKVECSTRDKKAYGIIMRGDALYPAIRDGWVLVVEPSSELAAGEYVLACLKDGRKMVRELMYSRRDSVALLQPNSGQVLTVPRDEIDSLHAIGPMIPPSRWR